MTETDFLDAISKVERDLLRQGLTLTEIQVCEAGALAITQGEFYAGPREYIATVNRLANSGLH